MYLKAQPYYDCRTQCYFSVLSLNKKPAHSLLKSHVVRVQNPKLSPFEGVGCCSTRETCLYVIKKTILEGQEGYNSIDNIDYLTFEDYPFFIDFLMENGFNVNTEISNMLQNHISHVPPNVLCFIGHGA